MLPREEEWRGAIERVLRGLALSLIVEERYYPAVSDFVNRTPVGDRLLYNRVGREQAAAVRYLQPNSLFRKVQIKEGPFAAYLEHTLIQRFDYSCVDSMQAFRNAERAVTRQGQVRHGKDRHEKDDRFDLNDRSRWVLGFDNRAKLALFERKAQDVALGIDACSRKIRNLRQEDERRGQRLLSCQTLANMQWQEVDAAPLLDRIAAIDNTLRELHEGNAVLKELDHQIAAQKRIVDKAQTVIVGIKAQIESVEKEMRAFRSKLAPLRERLKSPLVTREAKARSFPTISMF